MNHLYIRTSAQLRESVQQLSTRNSIAIDLEFDKNRFRYGFNLCLMQIFDGETVYLIDPLPEAIDISIIFPVLENPAIRKITYSFGEDLRLLHSLGCFPVNIYDLQMAAALLNFEPGSLASLVQQVLGIEVGKSSQQSNWFKRPLTDQQKAYAVEDVLYLLDLSKVSALEIENRGMTEWLHQECENMVSENHENVDHNVVLKEKHKGNMTQFEWHIFSKLMHFREELAQAKNRPAYHITDRKTLQEIAQQPHRVDLWSASKATHRSLKNKKTINNLEQQLLSAVDSAKAEGLSRSEKAIKHLPKVEYLAMKALEQKVKLAKTMVFNPIQKKLEAEFGEFTKTFILSNRLIKEIVSGRFNELLPYKKELLMRYAAEINADISVYLTD